MDDLENVTLRILKGINGSRKKIAIRCLAGRHRKTSCIYGDFGFESSNNEQMEQNAQIEFGGNLAEQSLSRLIWLGGNSGDSSSSPQCVRWKMVQEEDVVGGK
ncbi:hypothetical protein LOAG_03582 [Loa loa]|uniref:Uncharacterized protein n=1 Tax=Loa loa TaxID=7209 RepID=A0A1I7VMH2_LOALO|nr:hypothetical protein LOAG_03582 [Loa loa]EFO24902.1 hypothetical protein LOAG_03582 [Loa loa]